MFSAIFSFISYLLSVIFGLVGSILSAVFGLIGIILSFIFALPIGLLLLSNLLGVFAIVGAIFWGRGRF